MGPLTAPIHLYQPPTQKRWTLEGHLRAKIPCPVSLLPPLGPPQSHISTEHTQSSWVAYKGQPSGLSSVGGPGPGLAAGLQSAGLGRRQLEPSRKFEYALTAELALPTDPVSVQTQLHELTDHRQSHLLSISLLPSPSHLDVPRLSLP